MAIVNAGQLPVYDDIPKDLKDHVEDLLFNRRADATERMLTFAQTVTGEAMRTEHDLHVAGGLGRGAALARARPRHRRLHRGGRRGGEAALRQAARGDRGTADGWDADRRRPLRRREDVPATGREVRARDEEGGRLPRAVHAGGEGATRAGRLRAGHHRDRHGQRGRPRHREEHRGRRPRLQQLPGRRPRRDGTGRDHLGRCRAGEGGRDRALRPDHALVDRDGERGDGDATARSEVPIADRGRHDIEAAHGGEDRAGLLGAGRARRGRLEGGRRHERPARRASQGEARHRQPEGPGAAPEAPRGEAEDAAPALPQGAREPPPGGLATGGRRRRLPSSGRGRSSRTSRSSATTSTGRSSSPRGS